MELRFAADQDRHWRRRRNCIDCGDGVRAARSSPGLVAYFNNLGLKVGPDDKDNFLNLMRALKNMDTGPMQHVIASRIAGEFGVSETQFLLWEKHLDEVTAKISLLDRILARAGIDQKTADRFKDFANSLGLLAVSFGAIFVAGFAKLLPWAEGFVHHMQQIANWILAINQATSGWAAALVTVAAVLLGVVGTFGVIAAAATAIGSALGITGAAGGIARAAVGAGAGIGAGGPSQRGGLAGLDIGLGIFDFKKARQLYEATFGGANSAGGNFLTRMIEGFEGFRSHAFTTTSTATPRSALVTKSSRARISPGNYAVRSPAASLAGHGLGHASGQKPGARVRLNENQMAALTDFVYNVGGGNFAKSTMLKDLNVGDYAGASEQFTRFTHAGVAFQPRTYEPQVRGASAVHEARNKSEQHHHREWLERSG